MKSFAAIALSLTVAVASAADCDVAVLQSLISNPSTAVCGSESGVSLTGLTAAPTEPQMAQLCASDACVSLMQSVLATDPADCTLPIGGNILLRSQLFDPVVAYCNANGVSVSAASGAADAAVGSSSGATGSSSSAGGVDVGSDDDNSTVTTPEPTTGAAAGLATAIGATVAVALTLTGALL